MFGLLYYNITSENLEFSNPCKARLAFGFHQGLNHLGAFCSLWLAVFLVDLCFVGLVTVGLESLEVSDCGFRGIRGVYGAFGVKAQLWIFGLWVWCVRIFGPGGAFGLLAFAAVLVSCPTVTNIGALITLMPPSTYNPLDAHL